MAGRGLLWADVAVADAAELGSISALNDSYTSQSVSRAGHLNVRPPNGKGMVTY